jgi:hypothetical protein
MIKMYLSKKQKELFLNEFNILIENKKITEIEEKRIRNLFNANQKIKEMDTKEESIDYLKFIPKELSKIRRVVKKNPELVDEVNNLIEKTNDIFENGVMFYCFLCDLIKIEAALGIRINYALEYPLDKIFEEYYMEIINHHYEHNHSKVKVLK